MMVLTSCWTCRMALTDRIEADPGVMLGKPVIKGTRIPVELILRKLSEGVRPKQICWKPTRASHARTYRPPSATQMPNRKGGRRGSLRRATMAP